MKKAMIYLPIVGAMVVIERLWRVVSWIRSRSSDVGVRWRRTIKDLAVMICVLEIEDLYRGVTLLAMRGLMI